MFEPLCKISPADSGRNRTHDLLIIRYVIPLNHRDCPITTAGSIHLLIATGTALIYQLRILGWVDLIILYNFVLSQHTRLTPIVQCMFGPLWRKKISQADSGRNRIHNLLITRPVGVIPLDHREKPDGYGWFDSHNSSRYCVDLSIKDFRLGWI